MVEGDIFKIGNVKKDTYDKIMSHTSIKSMCLASCTDGLYCDYCVYKPYCGVCPVYSYSQTGNIFGQITNSQKCQISKGVLDYLFDKMRDRNIMILFRKWVNQI